MKTFVWKSRYLEQYASGSIVVNAKTVEDARKKVISYFDKHDREENEWNYQSHCDEDDKKDINSRLNILKEDISTNPQIIDVLFISGGE